MRVNTVAILLAAICLSACNNQQKKPGDTPTSGHVVIGVDESYEPLMGAEIDTFEALYPKADIEPRYMTENAIIKAMLDDSLRLALIGRDLTEQEKETFKKKTHPAFTVKVAVDAIALVIHPDNPDSLLTLSRIKNIFNGTDTSWSQVNPSSRLGTINIVFDNNGSANYRYIQKDLLQGAPMNRNAFAAKGNQAVIDYVSKNRNAIGVLSTGWITDHFDTTAQAALKKINIVAISEFDNPATTDEYRLPAQAWIYMKTYPLIREVYVVKLGTRSGLGTGFAAHLAGEKGQLIIHKLGMVAAQSPIRLQQMNLE